MKHREANMDRLRAAWNHATKRLTEDTAITAAESDAGFVIPINQPRGPKLGYQVFVRVCRYSEALLQQEPVTGGLLCHKKKK